MLVLRWGYSSAGRALAWHARGQQFDPAYLHHQTSICTNCTISPKEFLCVEQVVDATVFVAP